MSVDGEVSPVIARADCEAAKATKSDDELIAFWESMNDRLRNLGI